MSMKNLMYKPCWFHWDLYYMSMKTSLSCHINIGILEEPTTTVDHTELEISKIVCTSSRLIWRPKKKPLEPLLFCLFYICSTRSLLPLSPGSGFTFFLVTATQPRLRTLDKRQRELLLWSLYNTVRLFMLTMKQQTNITLGIFQWMLFH